MTKLKRAAIVIGSILPAAAQAHPGPHSEDLSASLVHVLSQPDHLAMMATILVWAAMVAAGWRVVQRGAESRSN